MEYVLYKYNMFLWLLVGGKTIFGFAVVVLLGHVVCQVGLGCFILHNKFVTN